MRAERRGRGVEKGHREADGKDVADSVFDHRIKTFKAALPVAVNIAHKPLAAAAIVAPTKKWRPPARLLKKPRFLIVNFVMLECNRISPEISVPSLGQDSPAFR